jgi:hypothetical protein
MNFQLKNKSALAYFSFFFALSNFVCICIIFGPQILAPGQDFNVIFLILNLFILPSFFWLCNHLKFSDSDFFDFMIKLNAICIGLSLSFFCIKTGIAVIEGVAHFLKISIHFISIGFDAGIRGFYILIQTLISAIKDIITNPKGIYVKYYIEGFSIPIDPVKDGELLKKSLVDDLYSFFYSFGYNFDSSLGNKGIDLIAIIVAIIMQLTSRLIVAFIILFSYLFPR